MKVVINGCYGGFGLSAEAEELYAKKSGFELFRYVQTRYEHEGGAKYEKHKEGDTSHYMLSYTFKEDHGDGFTEFPKDGGYWYDHDLDRDDPILVEVVEELKEKASGSHAELRVVEIPDGTDYEIGEYDGIEHIAETHQTWS